MKKQYIFILIFSILLIGIGVYYFSFFGFSNINKSNDEENDIDNSQYITLGEFLKRIIEKSIDNVDYELIKTETSHDAAPYLAIAENYDVVEKNIISVEKLDKPITKLETFKICALCDINIRHHKLKQFKDEQIEQMNMISDLEKVLLEHISADETMRNLISSEEIMNESFLTIEEAQNVILAYLNII